ncbi:MAG: N-acetylmuramoyl-L-alanine amidase [Acidobacteriota bacterium]|jgi:N-acetylmuramoyl-L-alanine amidase|nr:N-acetylmuramoyl-L-alanine amidase [Acidobacteriota bacterium]
MTPMNFRKLAEGRDENERHRILRGVYEENQSLRDPVGALKRKSSRGLAWQVRQWASICALLLALVGLAIPVFVGRSGKATEAATVAVRTAAMPDVVAPSASPTPPAVETAPVRLRPVETVKIANAGAVRSLEVLEDIPLSQMLNLDIRRIVVDAGHGGSDTGTVGKEGTMEKDITLAIALKLRDQLKEIGIAEIIMTRTDDTMVPLHDRVDFARAAKADMFISIHVNSLPHSTKNVVETFYFGPSRDQRTLQLADQENKGSKYGLSDFQEIVQRLGKAMKLQESKKLAEAIQQDLYRNGLELDSDAVDTGVKRAPFVVLMGLDVPSVLAEVSCMSSTKAERYLNSEVDQDRIAASIAAGIMRYQNKGVVKDEGK